MENVNATTEKKLDLTTKANDRAANARKKAQENAKEYVENVVLPILEEHNNRGGRFQIVCPPPHLVLGDVVSALTEKAVCTAKKATLRHRIYVRW
ncbi:MAG: hypothetical protein J6J13_03395 [Clostridia bacterium]|nr:hypothetical protein [Clostridia bacterium]